MFRVDYRKVNQGQSSDPLALFRPSKAYSPLFSQYSLTSISVVSLHKQLCVHCCACLCIGKSYKISASARKRRIRVFSRVNSAHTHLRAMSIFSYLLSKGIFWGSTGQWIPAYSCLQMTKHNWPTPTNNKIAVLKMCSLPLF